MPRGQRASAKKQDLWDEICRHLSLEVDPKWYSSGSNVDAHAFEAALYKIADRTGIPPSFLRKDEASIWRMVHKSQEAMLSAINAINNPMALYRLETFLFLFCNAWELLLKAKIAKERGIKTILEEDGEHTISFTKVLEVALPSKDTVRINLGLVNDLRNRAAHFVLPIVQASHIVTFQAGIRNYEQKLLEWFGKSVSEKIPFGMAFLISHIDKSAFDIQDALLNKQIDEGAAFALLEWQKKFEEALGSIDEGSVTELAIPINVNFAVVNNTRKADVLTSINKEHYEKTLVAIKYQNMIDKYPLSYDKVKDEVKLKSNNFSHKKFRELIVTVEGKEEYCGYNFRTKEKREEYERTGVLPKGTPKIYNQKVVEYLVENMN